MMLSMILGAVVLGSTSNDEVSRLADRWVVAPIAFQLKGEKGSAERAAQVAGRFGKILRLDSRSNMWIVDVDGKATVDGALKALRNDPRVKKAEAQLTELNHDAPGSRRVDVMERGLEMYKSRYQEFRKVAPPKPDGTPWRERAPRQEALGAQLWRLQRRAFPGKTVNLQAYRDGEKVHEAMPIARDVPMGVTDITTTFFNVGPRNLTPHDPDGLGSGDVSGRVNALAVDHTNDNVWYAGTAGGGVWKTTDGGTNWTPLSDSWPGMNVSSLAIDPNNANVIYAGGGDIPNLYVPVFRTAGLQKSTDGGSTWTEIGSSTFGEEPISDILVHPENSNIILVCTARVYDTNGSAQPDGNIYRSTNGGTSWTTVSATAGDYYSLAISAGPTGSRTIYCYGRDNASTKVFRSTNNGASFLATPTQPAVISGQGEVQASRAFSDTVYVTSSVGTVYRSNDNGDTWTSVTTDLQSNPGYTSSQSWYNMSLGIGRRTTVLPFTTDMLFVGHIDVHFASSPGGNWSNLSGPGYSANGLIHVDQHCLAPFPNNGLKMLVGCDGGVYELTYNTANNSWTYEFKNGDFTISQFYGADYHPTNTGVMLGGLQDNGTANANGNLSDWRIVTGYDGGISVINHSNTSQQVSTRQRLGKSGNSGIWLFRTNDNWATHFEKIGPAPAADESVSFIAPVAKDPSDNDTIYLGSNYLYRYTFSLNTISGRLGNQNFGSALESIAVAPTNSSRIYVGTGSGRIWMTTTGGTSWTELSTINLPDRAITSIAVHPTDQTEILVGLGGTGAGPVYRCPNTASPTWVNESGTYPLRGSLPQVNANVVMWNPFDPDNVFYVGTDLGLYRSSQGGGDWEKFPTLPNVEVTDLDYVTGTNYLMVATYGRGIWRAKLPEPVFVTSWSVLAASASAGVTTDFHRDDSNTFELFPRVAEQDTSIAVLGTSPVQTPLELDLVYRSSVLGTMPGREYIDVYDYTTGLYVNVYNRVIGSGNQSDEVVVPLTANIAKYVQAVTRNVRARVRIEPFNKTQAEWTFRQHSIGELHWRIIR